MIAAKLRKIIADAADVEMPRVEIGHPTDLSHGDYATNIAMVLAKQSGTAPQDVARGIVRYIEQHKPEEVERVEIAGPGFINFHLSRNFFSNNISEILKAGPKWGSNDTLGGKKVMVEYTSPNLFKPLHVGNLMSNIVGESVSRLIEFSGGEVKRANYPSDIGLTVAKAVWGLRRGRYDPTNINDIGQAYRDGNEAYESDTAAKQEIETINKALYDKSDEELNSLRNAGIATSKRHLDTICKTLGTDHFDFEFFESETSPIGLSLVREHVQDGIFTESDGAIVFRGEEHGLHTRVFINSAGLPTYEAKDIGLLKLKKDAYPFDFSITVTAVEQKEYFKVLFAAAEKIFPNLSGKLTHVAYGFLTLPTGKMSSRKGTVITGEWLLEHVRSKVAEKASEHTSGSDDADMHNQIAVAALKYVALKQATEKNIVFDVERSLSFEGDSGPYLQYAYTRTQSLLAKAAGETDVTHAPEYVTEVERLLYRFPEVVERAIGAYEPHYVTTYLTELAGAFNSWYAGERVIGSEHEAYALALTEAFATTMKNGLWLLGIEAPERM